MNSEEIGRMLLEISGKVMQRNRTLLLIINLIAAMVLIVVYLERLSFDNDQKAAHLIAYNNVCADLRDKTSKMKLKQDKEESSLSIDLSDSEKDTINKCTDLTAITGIVVSKNADKDSIAGISGDLYRLAKIQNTMKEVKLEPALVAPLGVGLAVPRNDLTIIFGALLIVFYGWLAFSFKQHARIVNEITDNTENKEVFNKLIEANFMFQTDERRLASIFVKLLYFAAPISMTVSLINNVFFLPPSSEFMNYLREKILTISTATEAGIVIALWIIGYSINESDRTTNIVSDEVEDESEDESGET